jgi:hypothetical protein
MGNVYHNMLNLYRVKSNPDFLLMKSDREMQAYETSLEFLTKVSLKMDLSQVTFPEDLKKVDMSDNSLSRAMKLHSMSKGSWVNTNNLNYNRLEYRSMYIKREDKTIRMWTDMSMILKVIEENNKVYFNLVSNSNIDKSTKSYSMISVIKRLKAEFEEENKEILSQNTLYYSEKLEMMYDMQDLMMKTSVKYEMTNWSMMLMVRLVEDEVFDMNKVNCQEYRLYKDSYTVDNKTLMEMEITDEYDDKTKVKDLFLNIPHLVGLDKIFRENKWLEQLMLPEASEIPKETRGKMFNMQEFFGITDIRQTLSNMFNVETMKNIKVKKEEDEFDQAKTEAEAFMKMPDSSMLSAVVQALLKVESNEDYLEVEYSMYDKNSIMKTMDYLVSTSMKTSLVIYKDKMRDYYKHVSKTMGSGKVFHNMLLWQINNALDYEVSDTMLILLYNMIMRSTAILLNTKPTTELKKFGAKMKDQVKESLIFIEKYMEVREDVEESILMFQ